MKPELVALLESLDKNLSAEFDDIRAKIEADLGLLAGWRSKVQAKLPALRDLMSDDMLEGGDGAQPEQRVLFCSPVTGKIESPLTVWGGDWFVATNWAEYYTATGKAAYHTGVDLNRPAYADAGAAVYAAADGVVVFSGAVPGWQGKVVVIKHKLEDGSNIWTRYAHIIASEKLLGAPAKRGDPFGNIADYTPLNDPRGDHLHYDVARIDLGAKPGDWPGTDLERCKRDYLDPQTWHKERQK